MGKEVISKAFRAGFVAGYNDYHNHQGGTSCEYFLKKYLNRDGVTNKVYEVFIDEEKYTIGANSEKEAIILAQASQIKLGKPYAFSKVLEKEEN